MKIWALSDLHLSLDGNKSMDVFGGDWENYMQKIKENWNNQVDEGDIVLVAGDISWAMRLEEAVQDLKFFDSLKGTKIIIKGNHEYWWKSISAVRNILPSNMIALQNDCYKIGNNIFCGTRGWVLPEKGKPLSAEDEKIYKREIERLKLTLSAMQKQREEGNKVFCMMHFPPFDFEHDDSEFTKLLEEYNVDYCIYGHLHNTKGKCPIFWQKGNVKYYFTSTDALCHNPIEICEC